jgi:NTP pyrophosphatase (non-canonical NTP hydrolase)
MSRRETSASIAQWGAETFGEVRDFAVLTQRARAEFEELDAAVRAGDSDEIGREAADVVILLHRLVGLLGKDLAEEVDAKMIINRNRQWRLSGDGVGQHG